MPVHLQVNHPEVVEEVSALCSAYDRALLANDVQALEDYFWQSDQAIRFGVTEELYGHEAISAFRRARVVNFGDRVTLRESVVALGADLAITTVEFSVTVQGTPRHGRQSQVWVRFPDLGWRIVSAHVSHRVTAAAAPAFGPATAYAPAAEALLAMRVDPAHQTGVIANLTTMAGLMAPLMAFDLPESEPAPRFVP